MRAAMNVALGFTITLVALVCCTDFPARVGPFAGGFLATPGPRGTLARLYLDVSLLAGLGFAGVALVIGRIALARAVARRASTPLPPHPADPLATYRDGPPAECPRHPFARGEVRATPLQPAP
jgi:hypothetical protein